MREQPNKQVVDSIKSSRTAHTENSAIIPDMRHNTFPSIFYKLLKRCSDGVFILQFYRKHRKSF